MEEGNFFHMLSEWGLFTWPNQDDWMNMTEIGEHDQKIWQQPMLTFEHDLSQALCLSL